MREFESKETIWNFYACQRQFTKFSVSFSFHFFFFCVLAVYLHGVVLPQESALRLWFGGRILAEKKRMMLESDVYLFVSSNCVVPPYFYGMIALTYRGSALMT